MKIMHAVKSFLEIPLLKLCIQSLFWKFPYENYAYREVFSGNSLMKIIPTEKSFRNLVKSNQVLFEVFKGAPLIVPSSGFTFYHFIHREIF